jgi:hypothetical protein
MDAIAHTSPQQKNYNKLFNKPVFIKFKEMAFNDTTFKIIVIGLVSKLRSHSLQKYAATWTNQNGCSIDDAKTCGH